MLQQVNRFQKWIQRHQVDLLAGNLLAVVVFFVFTPVIAFVTSQEVDYGLHAEFIAQALNGQSIDAFLATVPHFLFHVTVVLAYRLLAGISLQGAVFIVTLAYYIAGATALYWLIGRLAGRAETYRRGLLYAALALILLLLGPINLLTPHNRYMGYIPTSAYHNPTIVALKPFALVLFGLVMKIINPPGCKQGRGDFKRKFVPLDETVSSSSSKDEINSKEIEGNLTHPLRYAALCLIVVVLSILAKPNYVMAFLPAVVLAVGWAWWRGLQVRWGVLAGGVIVPAAVVLGGQALLFGATGGIIFSPLAVMYEWDRMINPASSSGLVLKFGLSILFPLCVYVGFFQRARRTFYLNLAWVTFGIGATYSYLLAEGGNRLGAGNFTWSGQITLLVLFAASSAFVVSNYNPTPRLPPRTWRGGAGQLLFNNLWLFVYIAVLGLHVVSGIEWYGMHTGWASMGYLITDVW